MADRNRYTRRTVLSTSLAAAAGLLTGVAGRAFADRDETHGGGEATELLIVGAGPFGLSLSAYAHHHGIGHRVVGVPMGFWKDNMPDNMLLRSGCDWSLDPVGGHSIDAYLETLGKQCGDVYPLSRSLYLDYARWFQREKGLQSEQKLIASLERDGDGLVAVTANGEHIRSRAAVLAIGFERFAHTPQNLAAMFPADRQGHTCHLVDFDALAGKRVLIIGGRQSAFEWTALIREAGAESVDVCYRHDTPLFTTSEWAWVNDIVDNMADDPGWYRRLSAEEKRQLNQRFWEEGRLKLEPWLAPRIEHDNVRLHPRTNVVGASVDESGMEVMLDDDTTLGVDHVVFATGYRVTFEDVPFLSPSLLGGLEMAEGFPVLGEDFQTSVPGLYVTSLAATRDFGAFLAFTVSCRAQATIIGRSLQRELHASVHTARPATGR